MRIGPIEINWKSKKSYAQLATMIAREKGTIAGDSKTNPITQLSEYSSWVSTCVSLIKDRVAAIPFKFYRTDTNEEISIESPAYKVFSKPFTNPNPLMSFRFIKSFCQIQLELCGMSAIYKAKNQLGQVWELWPLNMNYFMGAYDRSGRPIEFSNEILPADVYYVFNINGSEFVFHINDLILLMYPHPKNMWIGASTIQQQAYALDIQRYVEIYERDFFANSARIDMVLTTEAAIDTPKAKELKERWLDVYGPNRRSFFDVAVMDSGLKPVPMEYANKDFEFLHLSNWTKEMVFAAFRVPLAKVGLGGSDNRQNAVYVDINFNRECIEPRLNIWDDELTSGILQQFDSKLIIKHDNPIPRDRQIEVQEGRIYLSGFPTLTPNEFRKKTHKLPPLPLGDKLYVPSNFIPLDKLEKYIDAQITARNSPKDPNDTDPSRHDGDTPHVNPDGTDDRDDLPTDGRSFFPISRDLFAEFYFRNVWIDSIKSLITIKSKKETFDTLFKFLCVSTVNSYFGFYKSNKNLISKIENILIASVPSSWISDFSLKLSGEFYTTLSVFSEDKWMEQFDVNPRLAKICNTGVHSCINYSKFLILDTLGQKRKWVVHSNECGHRGRIKDFITEDKFNLGSSICKFPGENFNLSCDCVIDVYEEVG